jgi:hypothetical protein
MWKMVHAIPLAFGWYEVVALRYSASAAHFPIEKVLTAHESTAIRTP